MRPLDAVAESLRLAGHPAVPKSPFEVTGAVALVGFVAVLAVGIAVVVWRRRESPGSTSLAALALGAGWWSLAYALELHSPTLSGTLLFGRLSYLGIVVVPVAWLSFALAYTGRDDAFGRVWLAVLAVPAAAMVVLAWTTPTTGLVWRSYELISVGGVSSAVLQVEYGPVFWLWTAYAYALTAAGTLLLVLSVATARLFRRQTAVLLVGVSIPWIGNLAFVSGLAALDLTPVGFAVTAVVLAGGLRRYRLLDLHPRAGDVAREELVERLPEAVVALDDHGRIVDLNPSAESVLDTTLDDAVGTPLETVAPSLAELVGGSDADDPGSPDAVADYVHSDPRRYYEVRVSPLRAGSVTGRLVTLRDVTDRRRREQEVAVLNRVLRHDLRNDLAVIENYVGLLEHDPGNEEYIAGLADRAAEMRDLVETVRRVEGHLDAAEPTLSTLNVARVVRERTAAVERSHPAATVETDLPPEAWIRATDLVGSAVDNVVENAVEHNDAATPRVRVAVEPVTVDGERYVDVVVADDGPELPTDDRNVLLGRESSLEEASGLGLWLVNWIVTESGGTVMHEPNEPRGNVVTLRFRVPDGAAYHPDEAESTETGTSDATIDVESTSRRDVTDSGWTSGSTTAAGTPGAGSAG
jgi:PAS domain S-box-containing protein